MTTNLEKIEQNRWRELTAHFQDHNYHQIWDFGVACAQRMAALSEHVAIQKDNRYLGLADVRIKKIPALNAGVAYINGGPLTRQNAADHNQNLLACLNALIDVYVTKRKLALRIRPSLGDQPWNKIQQQIYERLGFVTNRNLKIYRTFWLDLNMPLEDLRKNLKQKWRNCLNNAEKNDCRISAGTDPKLMEEFCRLYDVLIERKKFDTDLDARFYYELQRQIPNDNAFYTSIAYYQDQPIAGHVSSMLGDTCVYLLGASNELGLKLKATYLLQWHTIETAVKKGCRWYDLGGIDPENNPGVYHFKKGLGGDDVTAPGPYELNPRTLAKILIFSTEKLYRFYKKIRKA